MFDLATFGAAIASLKTIKDLAEAVNNAQLSFKIVDEVGQIQGRLLDVQQQAFALQRENASLREELQQLRKNALVFLDGGVYWEKRPDGMCDGPLCPVCWGLNDKRLPMVKNESRNHPEYVVYMCNHHPAIVVDRKVPKGCLSKHTLAD